MKNTISLILVLILSGAITLITHLAHAEKTKFSIGVEDTSYLPHYTYVGDEYQGFSKELLNRFAQKMNYQFFYHALPVKRLLSSFLNGKVDFKYPDNPYWAKDQKKGHKLVYSQPVAQYIDGVMVLPEYRNMEIKDFKVLGTVLGFTPWDYLGLIKSKSVELEEVRTMSGLLEIVLRKRVDGAYVNIAVASYQLESLLKMPNMLVFNSNLPHTLDSYRLSSIKYPKVMNEFNRFLHSDIQYITKLKKKYKVEDLVEEKKESPENNEIINLFEKINTVKKPLVLEGSRGYYVEVIQKLLHAKTIYNGPINGQFTAQLTSAVKQFQKQSKLKADGMVGPNTWRALTSLSTP